MADIRTLMLEQIPHLRRYARALVRDVDKADDLVHDCLVRAISRADQWQRGTNLRAWLFTILYNNFISDVRRYAVRPRVVANEEQVVNLSVRATQEAAIELSELKGAIEGLPYEQRITILLICLEGMSYEEAADVMGVPIGTVRSRLSRARTALRHSTSGPSERLFDDQEIVEKANR
jgi:RNA polymerase sigma-70 factor (ECF subfamily)